MGNETTLVNHWLEGTTEMREALLGVAHMCLVGGLANADWVLDWKEGQLETDSYSEDSFQRALDQELRELVASMREKGTRYNPFMALSSLEDEYLAERFAVAFVSGTEAGVALSWLQGLDRLDERVQLLTDGVCQAEVKRQLMWFSETGYAAFMATAQDTSPQEHADTAPSGVKNEGSARAYVRGRYQLREVAKQQPHGFPWESAPTALQVKQLYDFLLTARYVPVSLPQSEIALLFSEAGPSQPIRFLQPLGKLVILFRWLAMHVLQPHDGREVVEGHTREDLLRVSHWLLPRLIGTFRDADGNAFSARQLSKSASKLMPAVRVGEQWYGEMDRALTSIAKGR